MFLHIFGLLSSLGNVDRFLIFSLFYSFFCFHDGFFFLAFGVRQMSYKDPPSIGNSMILMKLYRLKAVPRVPFRVGYPTAMTLHT